MKVSLFTKLSRLGMALVCMTAGLFLLAQQFGAKTYGCGLQCGQESKLWFAPFLVGVVILVSVANTVLILRDEWGIFQTVARLQGVAAVSAFALSVYLRKFCPLCLTVQMVWLALAIGTFQGRPSQIISAAVAACAVYVFVTAPSLAMAYHLPDKFVFRAYEGRVVGSPGAIVIFTDPLCPWCRSSAKRLDESRVPLPVFHRWFLLPQHGPAAVKLAAVIESANAVDRAKGRKLEQAIFTSAVQPNRGEVIKYGVQAGFGAETIGGWYDEPESASLALIESDGKLASSIGILRIPMPCEVDTVIAKGGGPTISMMYPQEIPILTDSTKHDFGALKVFFGP